MRPFSLSLYFFHSTLNIQHSTFNTQHSTLNILYLFQKLFLENSCRYENKTVTLRYRILKQMVMKYLDPKADLTFKKIFGNHPDRLRKLLNALQTLSDDELLHQAQYLPSVEELEISGFTDAELRAYDKFWDSVSVERTLLDDRYQKGIEKGRAEGREEGRAEGKNEANTETAQRLLAMGLSAEQVA